MLRRWITCLFVAIAFAAGWARGADRPNILLIMSDDMGFSDLGCYGGEIATPNLDRLAGGGLRFTQFYNTGRCCPTRASLLTGLYPHQAGVGHMMEDRGHEGYRGDLNDRCVTIAQVLKAAGYGTYMAGKWHVTRHEARITDERLKHNWPRKRGFDRFYGTITGAGSFYDPATLVRDDQYITPANDPLYRPQTYYYTDAITDNTLMFLREHLRREPNKPFFAYVAHTAAHWPMHALPEDIRKYDGLYDKGYEAIRAARLEKARALGVIDPHWKVTARDSSRDHGSPEWDWSWEKRNMEVYAAMIDRMDQGIGRIIDALEDAGQLDNTLIFFLQDNGACAEEFGRFRRNNVRYHSVPDAPPFAPMAADALQHNVFPGQTRDGFPVIFGSGVAAGPAHSYIAYGQSWANVSNTPFREYKHWVHEGGIATPLIVHWPAGFPQRNELRHDPTHLIDIMPTCVEVAGAAYPDTHNERPILPMEGRSLTPVFRGGRMEREAIYWEHEGNRAIRAGQWKLVAKHGRSWELYDMQADRTETDDLAASQPDRVEAMSTQWNRWAQRAQVLPLMPGK